MKTITLYFPGSIVEWVASICSGCDSWLDPLCVFHVLQRFCRFFSVLWLLLRIPKISSLRNKTKLWRKWNTIGIFIADTVFHPINLFYTYGKLILTHWPQSSFSCKFHFYFTELWNLVIIDTPALYLTRMRIYRWIKIEYITRNKKNKNLFEQDDKRFFSNCT